jgi:hypothetical protein
MSYRSVLVVACDPRDVGAALDRALELVERGTGQITLMASVRRSVRGLACAPYAIPFSQDQLVEECARETRELLERSAANVPADVRVQTVVVRGDVVSCVCEQVRKGGHEVVVLQRARRGAQRRIPSRTQVPVVVV